MKQLLKKTISGCGLEVHRNTRTGVDPLRDVALMNNAPLASIVDVGANVGQTAVRYARTFPGATIHSFEPVTVSYQNGKRNTGPYKQVIWHNLAVGNSNGNLVFYSSADSQLNSITHSTAPAGDTDRNEVGIVRLDDYLPEIGVQRIDLLKTDTEGHDLSVLQGSERFLEGRRIKYILCEVGFTKVDGNHSYFPPITDFLESYGYTFVGFYEMSNLNHYHRWHITYANALYACPSL